MKICKLCQVNQLKSNFYKGHLKCKSCCIKTQKIWANSHRDLTRKYFKKFKTNNPIRYKKQQQKYINKNRKILSEKSCIWRKNNRPRWNKYIKQYKKENINYRLSELLRSRIYSALKGITKSKSTIQLLGCTYDEFKHHLESKFLDGMNWDNYGKWHIDHIKPCALFNLSKKEEQLKCFNYKNLQPLWAKDNLKKHTKYTPQMFNHNQYPCS